MWSEETGYVTCTDSGKALTIVFADSLVDGATGAG